MEVGSGARIYWLDPLAVSYLAWALARAAGFVELWPCLLLGGAAMYLFGRLLPDPGAKNVAPPPAGITLRREL